MAYCIYCFVRVRVSITNGSVLFHSSNTPISVQAHYQILVPGLGIVVLPLVAVHFLVLLLIQIYWSAVRKCFHRTWESNVCKNYLGSTVMCLDWMRTHRCNVFVFTPQNVLVHSRTNVLYMYERRRTLHVVIYSTKTAGGLILVCIYKSWNK